jgi:hypothetical protein
MAYEHSYTGQIPPQIGNLGCLLVKNDGAPIGNPFVLPRIEDLFVSQLAERITARRSDIPSGVLPDLIYLWKTDPPLPYQSSSSELLRALNGLHLNEPGNERNVTPLAKTLPLSQFFTPGQLQFGPIHVIAQLPLDREKEKGSDICICTGGPVLRTIQFSGLRALFHRQISSTTYVRVPVHL